ncbi:hypothetical protein LTR56_014351 [Elasticomyces elasticus]|nr:hypothetical protein LTR56_014351 [Elasticomyces elasticus]KAK3636361.1 hypothetical protein LTR22_018737 [Elasticomyces elasticus]KAK4916607.1 hypothetical protein LTR49_015440 [Elasticomyces elasticus]KAK5756156.1 hypothetical protein LTS12_013709 [Elasticomyces elasticus]
MKWNRDSLDDYILLPAADGFVMRKECFFLSHYWHTSNHPDPRGEHLRFAQKELDLQHWSYIWVDWTCAPQEPRSLLEEIYFSKTLTSMPAIIRNCGFMCYYPTFKPRLWVLYEIAQYCLTSTTDLEKDVTWDTKVFAHHIQEMSRDGVHAVIKKYDYACTYERDKSLIVSQLDLLILLKRLAVSMLSIRRLLGRLVWSPGIEDYYGQHEDEVIMLKPKIGCLEYNGKTYSYTPVEPHPE